MELKAKSSIRCLHLKHEGKSFRYLGYLYISKQRGRQGQICSAETLIVLKT